MVKTLSTNNSNVLNDDVLRPVYFLKLEFPSGTTYLNSSDRNITFDSQSYLGAGTIGTMSDIEETSELQANGVKLTLTGIPSTYISIALTTEFQGSNATAYLGFLNSSYALVDDPFIVFVGKVDTMAISLSDYATIELDIENRLIDWERPRISRFTNEEQQNLYSGDKGLEFVDSVAEKELFWGVDN
tara:strand:- start:545 stop:1105 length:561 start_codon:yes stop_codon:yes gene_type:complete